MGTLKNIIKEVNEEFEEKYYDKYIKPNLRNKDGNVYVVAYEDVYNFKAKVVTSRTSDILGKMQKEGYEILDVKIANGEYRTIVLITYK